MRLISQEMDEHINVEVKKRIDSYPISVFINNIVIDPDAVEFEYNDNEPRLRIYAAQEEKPKQLCDNCKFSRIHELYPTGTVTISHELPYCSYHVYAPLDDKLLTSYRTYITGECEYFENTETGIM